jgi:hypothetical protein
MNGRIYDPILARFLSPDPNVQFVANLQSYNRYTYVLNNPLAYTDPTGFFISGSFDQFVNVGLALGAIAICAGSEGVGCGIAFAIAQTLYNAASARHAGASWDQIIETTALSMFASAVSAGVLNAAASESLSDANGVLSPGRAFLARTIGAATSGAFMGVFNAGITGNYKSLGTNVLKSAAQGVLWSTVAWAYQNTPKLSVESDEEATGRGVNGAAVAENRTKGGVGGSPAVTSASGDDAALDEILKEAFGEDKVRLAQAAVRAYDLDIPTGWTFTYDQSYTGNAYTDVDNKQIVLGPVVFDETHSAGWLGSTIGHELQHYDQVELGNVVKEPRSYVNNVNEIEAYDWEIRNAARFKLTATEIEDLKVVRSIFINQADPYYITQTLSGNYHVESWNRP